MRIVTYISQVIKDSFREIKVNGFGRSDTRTSFLGTSFGEDYIPPKNAKMVQISSTNSSESVIVCVVNKANDSLNVGEKVIYSTDANGNIKAEIHLRNDGTVQILRGEDFAVRYSELENQFNELNSKFNSLVSAYNSHVHTAPSSGGLTTTTPSLAEQSTADITLTKIEEIKVP